MKSEHTLRSGIVVEMFHTGAQALAGRASYFYLNTLSVHELGDLWSLNSYLLRGGWPELYASPQLDPSRYLNDIVTTYIEGDIVIAAGIERRAAFLKVLHLVASRVGQLFLASKDRTIDRIFVSS